MNNEIRSFLRDNNYIIEKITIKGNVLIVDVGDRELVVKKKKDNLDNLFKYLKARSFDNFSKIICGTNNYYFYEYINNIDIPREQKAMDIIKLDAILHSKTTFFKDVNEDYYKEIYEDIIDNIEYLRNYYSDMAEVIEREEFMSPSQYLFIRNISKIFMCLEYAKYSIDEWFKVIDEKKSIRIVNIHNNLSLDHYLVNNKSYFISWDKSKFDMPIYDLLVFYKKYYFDLDFCDLFNNYELLYPLLLEEKRLFFSLISMPDKINFDESEYKLCERIRDFYNYLDIGQKFVNDYFPENKKEHAFN